MHLNAPQGYAPAVGTGLLANGLGVGQLSLLATAAVLACFSIVQLILGVDPLVLILSVSSIIIGFSPIVILGRDIYTCFSAVFCLRYTGGAFVAKTLLGQSLDSYLNVPVTAYALANVLIITEVAIVVFARSRDRRLSIFPTLDSVYLLRQVGLIAFTIGAAAGVIAGLLSSRSDVADSGAGNVISNTLMGLMNLGLSAEIIFALTVSGRHKITTLRLFWMISFCVALALFLNVRAIAVNAIGCFFLCAFLFRMIRLRHVAFAVVAGYLFVGFLSPVSLQLRNLKFGMTSSEFLQETVDVVTRAATDGAYLDELKARQDFIIRYESGLQLFDYYGDNSTVLNRFSWVAIVDAVAGQMRVVEPIGFGAVEQVLGRLIPRFLYPNKEDHDYGYGDWLTWKLGLIENGRVAFLNFGLPNEGLALFGLTGFVLFPVLFLLPALLIASRISTFLHPSAASLFIFSSLQWTLFEGQTDSLISIVLRTLPILVIPAYGLYWLFSVKRA